MMKIQIQIGFTDHASVKIDDIEDNANPPNEAEKAITNALIEGINHLIVFAIRLVDPAYKEATNDNL
jgi:hypothetical protein